MASFNLTTAIEITKRLYPDGLESILYEMSPTYGLLKKWDKFYGEGKFLSWMFAPGAGGSHDFATAQANKTASAFKRPFITRTSDYSLVSMDEEWLEASENDKGAVVEGFKVSMDSALYQINHSISSQFFGNGGGSRGKLASGSVAGTTLTLENPQQAVNFHKGMYLQSSATDGLSGAVRAGRVQLAAVNRATGVLTATGNWNAGIGAIVNTDYLFREGDFGFGLKGLSAWNPPTAPTGGDSFFGIDRSDDPEWLAGQRYAPTTGNYEEILIDACALTWQIGGGKVSHAIMNPIDWANLVKEVGSKNVVNVPSTKPTIGYKALELYTGTGDSVKVIGDPFCPRYRAHLLNLSTWEIWSLKAVPRILNGDGNETLREPNADARELRVGGRLQVVCTAPQQNCVVTLPA